MVVIFHYVTRSIDPNDSELIRNLFQLTYYFNSGVDLFFVLSGFLITSNLLANKDTKGFFLQFIRNRILRILPLYYIVLIISWIAISNGLGEETPWAYSTAVPWYSYFVFLQNEWMAMNNTMGCRLLAIYWSLGIEIQFYLLAGVLFYSQNIRKITWILAILGVMALFFRYYDGTHVGRYTHFYCRMDSVFAGALIAIAYHKQTVWGLFQSHRKIISFTFLILSFVFIALTIRIIRIHEVYIPTLFTLLFSSAVLLQLTNDASRPVNTLSRILIFLGKYSFGIYVLHELVRSFIFFSLLSYEPRLNSPNDLVLTLISFALTLAIAIMSFNSIEKLYHGRNGNKERAN